jgi:hypothetical protein
VISSSKAEGSAGSAVCVGIGVVIEGEGEGEVMGGEAMMWIVLGYGQWII